MQRRDLIIIFLIVMLATVALQSYGQKQRDDSLRYYETLATVVERIRSSYVTPVTDDKIFEGALRGVVLNLDRYSAYIPPEDFEDFDAKTTGEFTGLGIEIGVRDGWLTVISPIENTPAAKAGMLAGDRIVKIEKESTKDMTVQDAVKRLRGKKGTSVNITIAHAGANQVVDLTITRDIIPLISVRGYKRLDKDGKWDFYVDKDAKIGYVRVGAFQSNTMKDLDDVLAELQSSGMKALILDLRFNPGGQLDTSVEMCRRFVSSGDIVSTRGRVGDPLVFRADGKKTLPYFPMVVLVNGWSASASEIVTGCLQDHKRAIIVGENTFGKGSVQTVFRLEDGKAALKLTTAHYFTPLGRGISRDEETGKGGLTPDIIVPTSIEDEARLQKLWFELSAPPKEEKPGEVTPAPAPAPAPAPVDPDDEFEAAPAPKAKPAFVDLQLQRAIDVLKALEIVAPEKKGAA